MSRFNFHKDGPLIASVRELVFEFVVESAEDDEEYENINNIMHRTRITKSIENMLLTIETELNL